MGLAADWSVYKWVCICTLRDQQERENKETVWNGECSAGVLCKVDSQSIGEGARTTRFLRVSEMTSWVDGLWLLLLYSESSMHINRGGQKSRLRLA